MNRNTMRSSIGLAVAIFILSPSLACAHLVTTGMGPVYDAIGHLLLTPEDLVPAIALALYAGMRGAETGRRAMFMLPVAWLIGGLAGSSINFATSLPIPAVSFLILGGIIAADLWLPSSAVAGLAVMLGFVHGFLNGAVLKGNSGVTALLGIAAMLFIMAPIVSALALSLKKPWERIAVRVAGSWIAAVGLLMMGWAIRLRQ